MWKAAAAVSILAIVLSAGALAANLSGTGAPATSTGMGGPGPAPTADLDVTLRVHPDSLNNRSQGRWVTAVFNFTDEVASDVDNASLQLQGIAAYRIEVLNNTSVMAKFPRADLIATIPTGAAVQLCLIGSLTDGRTFEGCDTIRVFSRP